MLFNELGRTGLQSFGGTVFEEFLPQLQGRRGVKVYTEMANNTAIVASMLFAIESLLRSVEWTVVPNSESAEDLAAAQFLEECRLDMAHTWEDFISEVLSMLVYGWAYFEQVYKIRGGPTQKDPKRRSKYNDGRIGWRKFAIRGQETLYKWSLDKEGGVKGLHQHVLNDSGPLDRFIPIEKSLLFRTTSHRNNPEGKSILRSSYRSWYFLKRIETIEAIGIERDLAGMPAMWVPPEIMAEDASAEAKATYAALKDVVTKVKRDEQEGLLLPLAYDENGNKLYDFELLSTGSRRQFDTGSVIQRYTQQIAMTVLADFILLGHENVGSFALSSDKTELFAVALGSWLDAIKEVLNRHAVPRLFELNTFAIDQFPQFEHEDIEKPDLQERAAGLQALATAGMPLFPDLMLENTLRDLFDLPDADPQARDEAIKMQQMQAMPAAAQNGNGQKTAVKKMLDDFGGDITIEDLAKLPEEELRKAVSVLQPTYFDGTHWKRIRGRHRWK
jgi:hypothetical protein